MSLSPKRAFLRVMPSVGKLATTEDWQVGTDRVMAAHGLRVEAILPLQRVARSTDPLWAWPTTFFASFIPRLVEQGLVKDDDWRALERDWNDRSRDENAFFWTPSMVEIIARRV